MSDLGPSGFGMPPEMGAEPELPEEEMPIPEPEEDEDIVEFDASVIAVGELEDGRTVITFIAESDVEPEVGGQYAVVMAPSEGDDDIAPEMPEL